MKPLGALHMANVVVVGVLASSASALDVPPPGFIVGYMADGPKSDAAAAALYGLAATYGASVIVHSGDLDYEEDPDLFESRINATLGPTFPYFASVGNHDDGALWDGYKAKLEPRCASIPDAICEGDYGVNSVVHYNGLTIVLSGSGTQGANHDQYIDDTLSASTSAWKVCSLHKPHSDYALEKGGGAIEVYEACQDHGAYVVAGHSHNYGRTKTIVDARQQTVDSVFNTPDLLLVTPRVGASPGRFFAMHNGLGGAAVRPADSCCSGHWAASYDDQHAILFIEHNVDGDPLKAYGELVNVDGLVIDRFTVVNDPTSVTTTTTAPGGTTTTTTTLQLASVLTVNGGFESGQMGWHDWDSSDNSGEAVRTSAARCEGTWSVQMFDSSSKTRSIHQDVAVTGDETHVLSLAVATKNLGFDQAHVVVQWWDEGTMIGQHGLAIDPGTASCTTYWGGYTAPSTATTARIVLALGPVSTGTPSNDAEVWYDAVRFGPVGGATPTSSTIVTSTSSSTTSSSTTTSSPSTTTTTVPAVSCPAAPDSGCDASFTKGRLLVKERQAGRERLLARWIGGSALAATDFGTPLSAGGTAYAVCVYNGAGHLAGEYLVDRAGAVCRLRDCWKPLGGPPGDPRHKGYVYQDRDVSADGIFLMQLAGDEMSVKGKNHAGKGHVALPTGVVATLTGSSTATIQLHGSDTSTCFSVTLPTVSKDDGAQFKAKK